MNNIVNFKKKLKINAINQKSFGEIASYESITNNEKMQSGIGYIVNFKNRTAIINRYIFGSSEIIIPSEINFKGKTLNVISFNDHVIGFKYIQILKFEQNTEIQIINNSLFAESNLEHIFLPSSVTRICKNAFLRCCHLQQIHIPQNSKLRIIEKNAFYLSSLVKISLPQSIEELQDGWCNGTWVLNSVSIHKNCKFYSKHDNFVLGKSDKNKNFFDKIVFSSRKYFTTSIPSFISVISSFSFSFSLLRKIKIPSHVKFIEKGAFSNCYHLKRVEFDENSELEIIQKGSFSSSSLKCISIPANVSVIGDSAFAQCKNLERIHFPKNSKLKTIGKSAFCQSSIECISIPKSVNEIGQFAFSACKKLQIVEIDQNNIFSIIGIQNNHIFKDSSNVIIMLPKN